MSIINDAIKKARKEFEWKNRLTAKRGVAKDKDLLAKEGPDLKIGPEIKMTAEPKESPEASETKWVAITAASLVLVISLLGSIFLYRHTSRLNADYPPKAKFSSRPKTPIAITSSRQMITPFPEATLEDIVQLNGIVYGPGEKWAIINDQIVREGDSLLNGRLAFIAKDFVRIEKDNGEDIVLELR